MKILHIANGYLDKKLYAHLFNHLDGIGVDNQIFVPIKYGKMSNDIQKNVIITECFSSLDRFLYFPKQKKVLNTLCANNNVNDMDIIHAHTLFSSGYVALNLKREFGKPYVVAVRNTDVNLFFSRMIHLRRIGLHILENAEQIIFLSPAYADTVVRKFIPEVLKEKIKNKVEILPNGIDDFFFQNKHVLREKQGKVVHIIHVGDIDKNKNISSTIAAIRLLMNEGQEIEFSLVGEIKDRRLKQIINTTSFIKFYEKCSKERLLFYLKNSDMLVMPSHHETFGIVYAEAMSQGLPVIYTKGQGFDGQFEDGHVGYSVDARDPKDIAEKIQMVLGNYKQLSSNCLTSVKKFDWLQIARQYREMYTKLLEYKHFS